MVGDHAVAERGDMSQRQILVVEDEPIVALDLQQRLQKMGYSVPQVVATGEAAVAAVESGPPDLVLMDISLAGDMDGVEAATQIRRSQPIPVVYLTAYSNDATLERAKATEPHGYLLKPFEERELQTTIEIALYKHQAEAELRRAHDELELRVAERTDELQRSNRFLQQEIAERRRREARQLALARVRDEVWRMQGRADIHRVLAAIWDGLQALQVPFGDCAILIVDAAATPRTVRVYDRGPDGEWAGPTPIPAAHTEAVLRIWAEGAPVYRPEQPSLEQGRALTTMASGGAPLRSSLDIPFSHGVLAVSGRQPQAFSGADRAIAEELAGVLSEGFRRMTDLQDLADERERLAVTLQSLGEGVIATDADGAIVLLNRAAEGLTGWQQEEARGLQLGSVFTLLDESTRQPLASPFERALATGAAVEHVRHTILAAREGAERLVSTSTAPIRDDEGRAIGAVLVSRDVGAERKMEEELLKSDKLESLGVLAGGIAHDFNNILTTVIGYLSLAKADIDPSGELHANLSEVEEAAHRATDLTNQLLAFSKGGAPVKKTASIAELIVDSATFTTRGSRTRCEFDLDEALWPVDVDTGQMSQVIQNLVLNASQAMPDGGAVYIRATNAILGSGHGIPLASGRYTRIEVADSGTGIPEVDLPRIFDPYFTTKHEGSGLGLATAFAVVKNHNGYIAVESELGTGATFSVYLPSSTRQLPETEEDRGPMRGHGRVLVLDDEDAVRLVVGSLLRRLGYEPELVVDGAAALEAYARSMEEGNRYFAVIMDLTVPGGMGGREAVRRLLAMDSQARVIVSSGYSDDPIMSEYEKHGFCGVMAKPYDIRELSRVLSRVIQSDEG